MTPHQLSREDARRIAVRAQLLDSPRPTDLLEVVRRLTFLQADQTATVAVNADLVLWSRFGSTYSPAEREELLDARVLVELGGLIRPAEDLVLYRAEMAAWAGPDSFGDWRDRNRAWVRDNEAFRDDVLERLRGYGPLRAGEIRDTSAVPWRSSGWNSDRNVTMMLEQLERSGEVAVSRRRGRERWWDLAERVYPDETAVPLAEALRTRDELRLRSLGIARPAAVNAAGAPALIDGVRGLWRVDPAQLTQPFSGRTALLSPLDRLVFDRKRMADLFAFDYQLEMYKPVAASRWGYFALPVLHGDRLVGKVDATADRKVGVLRVAAVHEDVAFDRDLAAAVESEITDLARWLGLELVHV